ncbi:MAG: Unknown protein [uncultured Sulfurovum sp.]|uniref:OmpA-like domain-containing protein n=1 Tax=uncultured Sulfurovum sp. TaxID=269237 RepID=A0A6S6TSC5_9BACT|nr:MAG: Unknown protein [uncultured Sulfurovum sp.]
MKKALLPLLFSSVLFADCTVQEEERANQLWQESRTMQYGSSKYQKLKQAEGLCNFSKIQIDTNIFLIANELSEGELNIQTIRKLEKKISQLRSQNNDLYSSLNVQQENAQYLRELDNRLVEIQISRNQGNLENLQAFQADAGNKKGLEEGTAILVPIKFANGKDKVQGNKNIDALVRKIKYTLSHNPNAQFTITGYASSVGNATLNESLSKRRATNTMRYIEDYIPKGKIKTFGMGESDLICNSGYAKNIGDNEYQCSGGSENEASSRRVEVLWR